MAAGQAVKRLDDSLRRYQKPGHEVLLARRAVTVKSDPDNGGMVQKQMFFDASGNPCITKDQLMVIIGDYENPSIDAIFFSDGEGGFIKPDDFGDELMYGPVLDLRYDDSIAEGGADQAESAGGDRAEYYRITRAPGL